VVRRVEPPLLLGFGCAVQFVEAAKINGVYLFATGS
jgi:hypothetical protein